MKNNPNLKIARKLSRERQLQQNALVGKRRAKVWGGVKTAREIRRDKSWKKDNL